MRNLLSGGPEPHAAKNGWIGPFGMAWSAFWSVFLDAKPPLSVSAPSIPGCVKKIPYQQGATRPAGALVLSASMVQSQRGSLQKSVTIDPVFQPGAPDQRSGRAKFGGTTP